MAHRVFISQPMRGRTDEDIRKERESIMQLMKEIVGPDIEEIPSFFHGKDREMLKPMRLLGMAIELLSDADTAIFAPGWEEGRGTRIEHECALRYGIHIIDLSDGQIEKELS